MERGIVKKITFEIEYPDGSTKESILKDEAKNLSAIILSDEMVLEKDISSWKVSHDWKDNPTMLLVYKDGRSTPHCRWKWHLEHGDWKQ